MPAVRWYRAFAGLSNTPFTIRSQRSPRKCEGVFDGGVHFTCQRLPQQAAGPKKTRAHGSFRNMQGGCSVPPRIVPRAHAEQKRCGGFGQCVDLAFDH